MPVIINEFEVLPAPQEPGGETAAAEGGASNKPRGGDIQRILEHRAERELRIRAY